MGISAARRSPRADRYERINRVINLLLLIFVALIPVTWLGGLIFLSLVIADEPAQSTQESIEQVQLLIAASQAIMAGFVAAATIYYAKRTGDMVKLMHNQTVNAEHSKRQDAVHSLLGSAMESAAFAGSLAQTQRVGLKWYRRVLPESSDVRDLRVRGWIQLSTSVTHVASAMERIRVIAPDLADVAWPLFDSVLEAQTLATAGDTRGLAIQADLIRERADELRDALSEASVATPPGT